MGPPSQACPHNVLGKHVSRLVSCRVTRGLQVKLVLRDPKESLANLAQMVQMGNLALMV